MRLAVVAHALTIAAYAVLVFPRLTVVRLAEEDQVVVDNLPAKVLAAADPIAQALRRGSLSIKQNSRIIEEELIRRALQQTGGNRTGAAKILEISHRALLYKIKDYGISNA